MSNNPMAKAPPLQPVRKQEIEIGKPLPWPVYDEQGNLLMREGNIIYSEKQLTILQQSGMFHAPLWNEAARPPAMGGKRPVAPRAMPEDIPTAQEKGDSFAFTDIRLPSGEIIQMQGTDAGTQRHFVRYIGYVEKGSILVTTPVAEGKTLFVKDGQGFNLRAFSGRRIFTFNTVVLRSCLTPYGYLHLAYPNSVRGTLIRQASRTKVDLICSLETPAGKLPARMTDLSIGGTQLEIRQDIAAIGDTFSLAFKIVVFEETIYLRLPAIVRRIDSESGLFRLGIQFSDISLNDRLALQSLLYYELIPDG